MLTASVVIPVHNGAATLGRCLGSVLAQSMPGLEVICVDDGSTDGSGAMLDGWAAAHPGVTVVHQAQSGSGVARNVGLSRARGEFVAFMDSDDRYIDGGVLELLIGDARRHGVDIAGGRLLRDDGGTLTPLPDSPEPFTRTGLLDFRDCPLLYGHTRFVYRRALLVRRGLRYPDYATGQDMVFLTRALSAAGRFHLSAAPVYVYSEPAATRPRYLSARGLAGYWAHVADLMPKAGPDYADNEPARMLTLWRVLGGDTTLAALWARVVRTAEECGAHDTTRFPADRAEMRRQVRRWRLSRRRLRARGLWRRGERKRAALWFLMYLKGKLLGR